MAIEVTKVSVIIRVEKNNTIQDSPRNEKTTISPTIIDNFIPRPINSFQQVPSTIVKIIENPEEQNLSRFEKLKEDSKKVIAGATYALDEFAKRMNGKSIQIDPAKNPELIQSLNYLYGNGGHNNSITFEMYLQLMRVMFQYGRLKAVGT